MFENYYDIIGFKKPREIQKEIKNVLKNKKENVLVISGCGSGKTEVGHYALLNWNGIRSIFVEPMKTLATSIQERLNEYNKILNINEKWTIQHSGIEEDKYLENKFCVTTIDQVLSGWLGIGRQSFIRGKNIVQSNFVFDEVQLFQPDKALLTTINFLDSINSQGNKFLIMTATMPKYLIDFLLERYNMKLIEAYEETIADREIYVNYSSKVDYLQINSRTESQIVICNTQAQQEEVYNNIEDKSRCIILNSKLLKYDRSKIESKNLLEDDVSEKSLYKYFGKYAKKNNKILIATSIVEAGVDISANYLYSYACPIDNFIQRCGRCARWGGIGQVVIINSNDIVYDSKIVKKTIEFFADRPSLKFTWEIQKAVVTNILNPFYMDVINEINVRKNKYNLIDGSRGKLIRDIQNVNIIVDKDISFNSFKKQSISINISVLEKLSKNNALYVIDYGKNRNSPVQKKINDDIIGQTIVIQGNDCIYDELGFRYKEGSVCNTFQYDSNATDKYDKFNFDYKEESWINHATSVRALVKQKMLNDRFSSYVLENIDDISNVCGLHDIGKLDEQWQGPKWAGAKSILLAHFPFKKANTLIFKNRNHRAIGYIVLKNNLEDRILLNVVLQHHGRIISNNHDIIIDKFGLHKNSMLCLYEYGFYGGVVKEGNDNISYEEILTPKDTEWNNFLYIVGTLMESDIESINLFHNTKFLG
ncbi:CRISPR-associated helicase Cas3' [Clostridium cellulovorans]|uniref:CRISPR-associated helicase Cas3 n=1 Tax=Clostridium cellulovorans (strain ATCC 35296 / DSM 3052 / OCM 3 / 743B) TaxID=573061 RepID=D9SP79_CLOC7|nr:CRISPR-associated helicase Cas3' [Clostridium cellulovorans]ADL52044.1 CRISPR-associated helicase Cas3 [Clostridium cellulovorans 743B]